MPMCTRLPWTASFNCCCCCSACTLVLPVLTHRINPSLPPSTRAIPCCSTEAMQARTTSSWVHRPYKGSGICTAQVILPACPGEGAFLAMRCRNLGGENQWEFLRSCVALVVPPACPSGVCDFGHALQKSKWGVLVGIPAGKSYAALASCARKQPAGLLSVLAKGACIALLASSPCNPISTIGSGRSFARREDMRDGEWHAVINEVVVMGLAQAVINEVMVMGLAQAVINEVMVMGLALAVINEVMVMGLAQAVINEVMVMGLAKAV
eukprot:1158369-Pelagomonas_calceolata.AAC.11